MSEIKALLVGVSDYSDIYQENLLFCKNDIDAVEGSLVEGLKVKIENVVKLGTLEVVNKQDFFEALKVVIANIDEDDIFIFYFSGHGGNLPNDHYLAFSDGLVKTQEIISVLDRMVAKSKIIILDSCMSGNFGIKETAEMNEQIALDDFIGKGYIVFASSSETQSSYPHRNRPLSLFTSFLCEALTDKHLIKNGNKSLYDMQRLLLLYLNVWNKRNPDRQQNPILRANMGGTILFPVEDYVPYKMQEIYLKTEKYIIYSVSPFHTAIAKRYSVQAILKEPFSFEEIAVVNHEIINKMKNVEVHKNSQSEIRWKGKSANVIWCHFGRDEMDITNSNYICSTTWVDKTQDKSKWYKVSDHCEVIDNIHFNIHDYYSRLKIFNLENTGKKRVLVSQTKKIMSELISLAERVIALYRELLNGTVSEQDLVISMEILIPQITKWYLAEEYLELPPTEIKSWCQSCSNLAATIHDFTLYYNKQFISRRTSQNRMECMDSTINRYYSDLEKLKLEEQKCEHLINSPKGLFEF